MDQATYDQMPQTLKLRQVEVQVRQPGFRTESLVVVTTLLNAKKYRREEIADLYRRRWQVEVYQPEYVSSAHLYQLAA